MRDLEAVVEFCTTRRIHCSKDVQNHFNSNKSPTRCNNFPVYYPDVYLQLDKFRAFTRPSSGAQWLQWQPLGLPSYRGDSRSVFVIGPVMGNPIPHNRPDHEQQHGYHHDANIKPESVTAVVELLMMGVRTPETCWAVNKRQDNKLEKLLHLVDLFELYDDARTHKL